MGVGGYLCATRYLGAAYTEPLTLKAFCALTGLKESEVTPYINRDEEEVTGETLLNEGDFGWIFSDNGGNYGYFEVGDSGLVFSWNDADPPQYAYLLGIPYGPAGEALYSDITDLPTPAEVEAAAVAIAAATGTPFKTSDVKFVTRHSDCLCCT